MASVSSPMSNSSIHVTWMWQKHSKPSSGSESELVQWNHYSDVENLIIEEEFSNGHSQAILDDYYINFRSRLQISKFDHNNQIQIKRIMRNRENKKLREERFVDHPTGSARSFGGQYGWVSPFVLEVRRVLSLHGNKLPSRNPDLISVPVEKAAQGIIEERKSIEKQQEAIKYQRCS